MLTGCGKCWVSVIGSMSTRPGPTLYNFTFDINVRYNIMTTRWSSEGLVMFNSQKISGFNEYKLSAIEQTKTLLKMKEDPVNTLP